MEYGKLIVIAGTDGSGKETQVKKLRDKLINKGYKVEIADFPRYGLKSAALVEEYLNGKFGSAKEVDPKIASIFYACDRYAASFKIKEWLSLGKIVLCNRYVSANMGHQAGKIDNLQKRDEYLDWLYNLEFNIFKIPKPDVNIFLYLNPEISRNLSLKVKKQNIDKKKDIHENNSEHMIKASRAYKYVAKKYNWIQIDCNDDNNWVRNIEDIHQELYNKIKKFLK